MKSERLNNTFLDRIDEALSLIVNEVAEEEIKLAQQRIEQRVRARLVEVSATISRNVEFEPFGPKVLIRLEMNTKDGTLVSPTDSPAISKE